MTTTGRGRGDDEWDLNQVLRDFRGDRSRGPSTTLRIVIGLAVFGVLTLLLFLSVGFFTEWLWYDQLKVLPIYQTFLAWQVGVFLAAAVIALAFLVVNILIAQRLSPKGELAFVPPQEMVDYQPLLTWGSIATAALAALLLAGVASDNWQTILLAINATPFGKIDPLFGRDAGFYVFTLPLLRAIQGWLMGLLVFGLLAAGGIYGVNLALRRATLESFTTPIRAHILILGSAGMALLAWGYQLDLAELVYAEGSNFTGAGYTAVNANLVALQVLTVVAAITAILLIVSIRNRGFALPAFGIGTLVLVAILLGNLYPAFIQRFIVAPNELERETPFLTSNIEFTRYAFGLDQVQNVPFPANETVTLEAVRNNPATIRNIRLWDPRPLRDTLNQIQTIRAYYGFPDIDVDRYTFGADYQQVMIGTRELIISQLAAQAQNWTNRTLQFTHGFGIAMTPVNQVQPDGLPKFIVQDIPPVGALEITRPEIYFGERTNWNVIVDTRTQEFNYPSGDTNVFTTYSGEGGVVLDSFIKRAAYAWYLGDINILTSEQLTDRSRILYRREIRERVAHITPFLTFDVDPYIVVTREGRLVWLLDGYTTTRQFPYANRSPRGMNYIRNAVKVTVDAYDGTVRWFVADSSDPIIQSWQKIFPGILEPLSAMPEGLRQHLRYPEDMFSIQAQMYQTYHMTDPRVFFTREDVFRIPREIFDNKEQDVIPYYVIIKLLGEKTEEFMIMLPFTPGGTRNNTAAWLAGRSDGGEYGKLLAYTLPKDRSIPGPLQIESRITQEPRISAQFSLWSNGGARIIRGNLLMIPIEESFLYIEPIFLQSQGSPLPELKRMIVATGNRIAMEPTLAEALDVVFGLRAASALEGAGSGPLPPGIVPTPGPALTPPPAPVVTPTVRPPSTPVANNGAALSRAAVERYNRAQDALRRGDFAAYGEDIRELEAILNQLVQVAGP